MKKTDIVQKDAPENPTATLYQHVFNLFSKSSYAHIYRTFKGRTIVEWGPNRLSHMICTYSSPQSMEDYLSCLLIIINSQTISLTSIYSLLTDTTNDYKEALGHQIAWLSNALLQKFFNIVQTLERQGLDQQSIFDLLNQRDDDNRSVGYRIVRKYDLSSTQHYFNTLFDLKKSKQLDEKKLTTQLNAHFLDSKKNSNVCMMDLMITGCTTYGASIIYFFVTNGFVTLPAMIEKLKACKEALLTYIKTLQDDIAYSALRQSLNKETPLGQIFWAKRGAREPALERGILKEIKVELEHRENRELQAIKTTA